MYFFITFSEKSPQKGAGIVLSLSPEAGLKNIRQALNGVTAHKDLAGDHEGVIERGRNKGLYRSGLSCPILYAG
jgi:hypothetical protein